MSVSGYLIYVVFLHCADGIFYRSNGCSKKVKLSPSDPCTYITQNISFNCSTNGDPNDLQFFVGTDTSPYPSVHILDNRTASITLENVTMSMNLANIECRNKMTSKCSDFQMFRVFEFPEHGVNLTCIVDGWSPYSSMTCKWHLRKNYHIAPYVTLMWRISGYDCEWTPCPNYVNNTCLWRSTDDGDFSMKSLDLSVTVGPGIERKCLDRHATTYYKINTKTIVKPQAVDSLKSHAVNSSCVQLSWKPNQRAYKKLYKITCTSKWGDVKMEEIEDTPTIKVDKAMIGQFVPYTQYTCTVIVKPYRGYWSGNDNNSTACEDSKCTNSDEFSCITNSGFWSDARTTVVNTYGTVPSAAPAMTEGDFMWNPGDCEQNQGYRKVSIYWKPLNAKDKNGPLIGYDIIFYSDKKVVDYVSMDSLFYSRLLKCGKEYNVSVQARNVNGTSPASSIIIHSGGKGFSPPSFIVEMSNYTDEVGQREVEVSWSKVVNSLSLTGYTVYRCRKAGDNCVATLNGQINWQSVAKDVLSLSFNMTEPDSYMYGVSMETKEGSSGFHWQSCVYTREADPKPPKNVVVRAVDGGSNLIVSWDKLSCDLGGPYIVKYIVKCCEINETKCKDVEVSAEEHSVELQELKEEQGYGIEVQAVAKSGLTGPWSKLVQQTTNKVPDSTGKVVGAVFGSLAFVGTCILIGFCWRRFKHEKEMKRATDKPHITMERQPSDESGYEEGFDEDGKPITEDVENEEEENGISNDGYVSAILAQSYTDSFDNGEYIDMNELRALETNDMSVVEPGQSISKDSDHTTLEMEEVNCSVQNEQKSSAFFWEGNYRSNDSIEKMNHSNGDPYSVFTEISSTQVPVTAVSDPVPNEAGLDPVNKMNATLPDTAVSDYVRIEAGLDPVNKMNTTLPDTAVSDHVPSEAGLDPVNKMNTTLPDTAVSDPVPSDAGLDPVNKMNTTLPDTAVSDHVPSDAGLDPVNKMNTTLPDTAVSDHVPSEAGLDPVNKMNTTLPDTADSDYVHIEAALDPVNKMNTTLPDTAVSDPVPSEAALDPVNKMNTTLPDTTVSDSVPSEAALDPVNKLNTTLPDTAVSDPVPSEAGLDPVNKLNTTLPDTAVSDHVPSEAGLDPVNKMNATLPDTAVSDYVHIEAALDPVNKMNTTLPDTAVSDYVRIEAGLDPVNKMNTTLPDTAVSDPVPSDAGLDPVNKMNATLPDTAVSDYVRIEAGLDPVNKMNATLPDTAVSDYVPSEAGLDPVNKMNAALPDTAVSDHVPSDAGLDPVNKMNTTLPDTAVSDPVPSDAGLDPVNKMNTTLPDTAVSDPVPSDAGLDPVNKMNTTLPDTAVSDPVPSDAGLDPVNKLNTTLPDTAVSDPVPSEAGLDPVNKMNTTLPDTAVSDPVPSDAGLDPVNKLNTTLPDTAVSDPVPSEAGLDPVNKLNTTLPDTAVSDPVPSEAGLDPVNKLNTTLPDTAVSDPVPSEAGLDPVNKLNTTLPDTAVSDYVRIEAALDPVKKVNITLPDTAVSDPVPSEAGLEPVNKMDTADSDSVCIEIVLFTGVSDSVCLVKQG